VKAALVLVGVMVVPAMALKLSPEQLAERQLQYAVTWLAAVRADVASASKTTYSSECAQSVADAKDTIGTQYTPLRKYGKRNANGWFEISPAAAKKLCDEAALVHDVVLKDVALFSTMINDTALFSDTSRGTEPATFGIAQADKCVAAVDALTKAGIKASHPFVLKGDKGKVVTRTVGQLKAKVCETTRTAANRYAKKLEAETKAKEARIAASGLSGDKLDWYRHYNGNVFLVGGEQPTDLKKLASAEVWFGYARGARPDRDSKFLFTVRRYTFAGNKLQSTTETQHWGPPSFEDTIGSVMK